VANAARATLRLHSLNATDRGVLKSLADLKPETLAVMHGSTFVGQCDRLLTSLASEIKENFAQA
jgi:hypothetical protein